MKCSVIIPVYNRFDKLRQCLAALTQQDYPKDRFEVIVVNDGSEGTLPDLPEALDCRVIHIEHSGQAVARNHGIRSARGEFLLFLDSDVMAEPQLIREHMRFHNLHPGCAVLGGIDFPKGKKVSAIDSCVDLASYFSQYRHGKELSFIQFLTCNISVRTSLVREAGDFSEDFNCYGYEDIELGYRLKRLYGTRIIYNEMARGYHHNERSLDDLTSQQEALGRSQVTLLCLHPEIGHFIDLEVSHVLRLERSELMQPLLKKREDLRKDLEKDLEEGCASSGSISRYAKLCRMAGIHGRIFGDSSSSQDCSCPGSELCPLLSVMLTYHRVIRIPHVPDTILYRYREARNLWQHPGPVRCERIGQKWTRKEGILVGIPSFDARAHFLFQGFWGLIREAQELPCIRLSWIRALLFILSLSKLPLHTVRLMRRGYPLKQCLLFPVLDKFIFALRVSVKAR